MYDELRKWLNTHVQSEPRKPLVDQRWAKPKTHIRHRYVYHVYIHVSGVYRNTQNTHGWRINDLLKEKFTWQTETTKKTFYASQHFLDIKMGKFQTVDLRGRIKKFLAPCTSGYQGMKFDHLFTIYNLTSRQCTWSISVRAFESLQNRKSFPKNSFTASMTHCSFLAISWRSCLNLPA